MRKQVIKISYQDENQQYNSSGEVICRWSDSKESWIVTSIYEKFQIESIGFAPCITLKQFSKQNPNFENNPTITVLWGFHSFSGLFRAFGDRLLWEEVLKKVETFPVFIQKNWNFFSFQEVPNIEAAIKFDRKGFHGYCNLDIFADEIIIRYNENEKTLKPQE